MALLNAENESPETAFGSVVLAVCRGERNDLEETIAQAADTLGSVITTASKDAYHRFYGAIVNLHILHEIGTLSKHMIPGQTQRRPARADTNALTNRLELSAPTFHTRESILNMRRNILRIT